MTWFYNNTMLVLTLISTLIVILGFFGIKSLKDIRSANKAIGNINENRFRRMWVIHILLLVIAIGATLVAWAAIYRRVGVIAMPVGMRAETVKNLVDSLLRPYLAACCAIGVICYLYESVFT